MKETQKTWRPKKRTKSLLIESSFQFSLVSNHFLSSGARQRRCSNSLAFGSILGNNDHLDYWSNNVCTTSLLYKPYRS